MIALMVVVFLSPYCHSMLNNHDVCGVFAEPLEASDDHPLLVSGSPVKKTKNTRIASLALPCNYLPVVSRDVVHCAHTTAPAKHARAARYLMGKLLILTLLYLRNLWYR